MSRVIKGDLVESLTSRGFRALARRVGKGPMEGQRQARGGGEPQMTADVRVEDN